MIGILDSTIGGLAIAKAVEQLLPEYSILFLADIARAPYNRIDKVSIVRYSIENTRFLIAKGATIIVIGCNSIASIATETIQQTFDIPVFDIVTPAVQKAVKVSNCCRIGVIGSRAAINSNIYSTTVTNSQKECKVFSKACPLLVPLVEEKWITRKETKTILRKYLYSLKNQQIDTLILGNTHYSLLKQLIQPRIGRKVTLVDSSIEVVKHVKHYLENMLDLPPAKKNTPVKRHYAVTDLTETTKNVTELILKRPIQLQLI